MTYRIAGLAEEAEEGIHASFENPRISCIHARAAAPGCVAARIEPHGGAS